MTTSDQSLLLILSLCAIPVFSANGLPTMNPDDNAG